MDEYTVELRITAKDGRVLKYDSRVENADSRAVAAGIMQQAVLSAPEAFEKMRAKSAKE